MATEKRVEILKAPNVYVPDDIGGDFIRGEDYILPPPDVTDFKTQVFLSCFDFNPWVTLRKRFGVDSRTVEECVKYECPLEYGNKYYWLIPQMLVTDDPTFNSYPGEMKSNYKWDMACDVNFWRSSMDPKAKGPILSDLHKVFMGHGYTGCTGPNDGDGRIIPVGLILSNGDMLWCWSWIWYNK